MIEIEENTVRREPKPYQRANTALAQRHGWHDGEFTPEAL